MGHEVAFQALHLALEQVAGLVNEAEQDVGRHLGGNGLQGGQRRTQGFIENPGPLRPVSRIGPVRLLFKFPARRARIALTRRESLSHSDR